MLWPLLRPDSFTFLLSQFLSAFPLERTFWDNKHAYFILFYVTSKLSQIRLTYPPQQDISCQENNLIFVDNKADKLSFLTVPDDP